MVLIFRESDIVKKPQLSSFKFSPIATAVAIAITSQFAGNVALAGAGFGAGSPATPTPTYYANSPAGPAPTIVGGVTSIRNDGSALPVTAQSGTLMRKFVDTLPGFGPGAAPGVYSKTNKLGQYIPVAVAEKWANPLVIDPVTKLPLVTADDYYEIAAVEFTERMHSDLPKATHLRGYVQLSTATNPGKHIQLFYPAVGAAAPLPILDAAGLPVYAYDNPHHLGPVITANKGTAVRVKFTNYLPVGGKLFLPVDPTITGAGVGADGVTPYTQNRAGMHLVGGQAPWVSAGSPHQWVAPAGEVAAYAAGLGKGASAQTAPDMTDPGAGSTYMYFPNDMSARFTFIQDRTTGLTRLNAYAGLEAGYVVTDPVEQQLTGTLPAGVAAPLPAQFTGVIPSAQIPLIIEDKTFVPANVDQQDALWNKDPLGNATGYGAAGDLWFPHVYEPNQSDPALNLASGVNPVGRWDYGPRFWPIFPVVPAKATLPSPSFVPEAYMDTPLINGTAYPTLTVEPKAYRVRILNASNDRYVNLGLYKADTANKAPQLDLNGNPIVDAQGNQQFFVDPVTKLGNTEVKMVPASPIDTLGSPPGWDVTNGVQLPLPQFGTTFPWNINAEPSGPTRAWPVDGRTGGAPDPTMSGPDFVVIGNDGGLLPQGVDIPPQPVTYEQNRRSITVTNIYGYGLLLGPSERADTIVDFSAYAGQTLILYNDAPAPTPFNDPRNDYYTGNPDQTATGGSYSTQPGYGPNTRTMMQIVVGPAGSVTSGGPLNATALAAALPAAYGASQPAPLVPEVAYNAAFGTTDADNYGRVATGSAAQPNLNFARSANSVALVQGPMNLITSGGPGTGSGTGYVSVPNVVITPANGGPGSGASATATINAAGQVSGVNLTSSGSGYTAVPNVTFVPTATVTGAVVADGGQGYVTGDQVLFNGGSGSGAVATVIASSASPILGTAFLVSGGSGYTVPPTVSFTGGGGSGAAGTATISSSPISTSVTLGASGANYSAGATATLSTPQLAGTQATATPILGFALSPTLTGLPAAGGFVAPVTVSISPPNYGTAGAIVSPSGVTLDVNGVITGITIDAASPTAGYTVAPTVTITDSLGAQAAATASLAAGTGQVFDLTVTNAGTGYTVAPSVTFADAAGGKGAGAVATVGLANPAGIVTSFAITNVGTGYSTTPKVVFTDSTNPKHSAATAASATVGLSTPAGTITGIKVTNAGSGYTSAPTLSVASAAGTGAVLTANIAAVGVGAQATVVTSKSASLPVLTKAEQELYDDWGRYNSTGGVELPYTLVGIQTTIPLNYIDAPTDVIGDDEVQIWKLVDNGFWSNSIHFSMADVQLLNRVGWDGTVKPPASNEVGWKDTVRLNPLEDAIVAVRAKTASVPFGQPRSNRLQDPSKPVNAAGSGLGFTTDPNVVTQGGPTVQLMANAPLGPIPVGTQFLSTATNTNALPGSPTGNYDNEFTWGSAVLGHGDNDFTRPVVFNPIVLTPGASALADPLGTGTLNWTDPTPASTPLTTLANPQNEVGFKLLQAAVTYDAAAGSWVLPAVPAWTPLATPYQSLPANVTQYVEPAANLAPTTPATGPFYAYQVAGWNVAGASTSNIAIEAPPNAPTGPDAPTVLKLTPSFITPATTTSDVSVQLGWIDNAVNETNYIVTKTVGNGTPTALPKLPPNLANGSTLTTYTDTPLVEGTVYKYDVIARNSFGDSNPVLSGTITAPISVPLAPTGLAAIPTPVTCPPLVPANPKCAPDDIVLSWTDAAFNETGYTVDRTGGAPFATVPLAANTIGYVDHTAVEGVTYTYTVTAVNTSVGGLLQSRSAATTAFDQPTAPNAPTNVVVTPSKLTVPSGTGAVYEDKATVTWNDNAYNEAGYVVTRTVANVATNPTALVGSFVSFNVPGSSLNNPMGTKTPAYATAGVPMSYTDSGLIDGVTYNWSVAGVNLIAGVATTGVAAISANTAASGIVITPPQGLIATPNRAGSSIGLQWTDMSNNETDFLVEEQTSSPLVNGGAFSAWSVLGTVARSTVLPNSTGGLVNFNRANVPTTAGLIYNFRVSARNLAQLSDSHPYLQVQASLAQPTLTAVPTLAVPTLSATGRVGLSWTAVTPPTGTTIAYIIYANGAQLARTNVLTYNYRPTLAALQAGISYQVAAVATAIRVANPTVFGSTVGPLSTPPQVVQVTAPTTAPTGLVASAPANAGGGNYTSNLTWNSVTGATGYVITPTLNGAVQAVINVGAAAGTTQTRAVNLVAGNTYTYTVAARDLVGTGPATAALTVNTPAAANTAVTSAAGAAAKSGITVSWTNISVNLTATPFTVQRRTVTAGGANGAWVTIPTPAITKNGTGYSIIDATYTGATALVTGTGYSYHILANGAGGPSAYSAATARVVAP